MVSRLDMMYNLKIQRSTIPEEFMYYKKQGATSDLIAISGRGAHGICWRIDLLGGNR